MTAVAGGQAASKAFTALANPVVGIGAVVEEFATVSLLHALGIDNPTVVAVAGAGAGIVTAAIAGGAIAGPIGAGVWSFVGAGGWMIGQGVGSVYNAVKGSYSDNWCDIDINDLRRDNKEFCASNYNSSDGLYWKSYQLFIELE